MSNDKEDVKKQNKILGLLLFFALSVLGLEVVLRYPDIFLPSLLSIFGDERRLQITAAVKTLSQSSMVGLKRNDGGPPEFGRVFRPFSTVTVPHIEKGMVQTVQMDKNGFCNPAQASDYDEVDIIVIGDSYSFCTTVHPHETWSHHLSTVSGKAVYNLSIPGGGPYEYLHYLRHYGLGKSPKMVILSVYEGNDIRDTLRFLKHKGKKREFASSSRPDQLPNEIENIETKPITQRESYLVNVLRGVMARLVRKLTSGDTKGFDFRFFVRVEGEVFLFNPDNRDVDEIVYAHKLVRDTVKADIFIPVLEEFVRLSREHTFVPVVVYSPSSHTTYHEVASFKDSSFKEVLARSSEMQRNFFSRHAKKIGYQFIDLSTVLGASSIRKPLLHFPSNMHFTKHGNLVVAKDINRQIIRRKLLD